jgi:glucose-6-phosphate 1-dehydrogenase
MRLSPQVVIAVGVCMKVPGEAMVGENTELIAIHQRGDEMTPYERLLGDALRGDSSLFAREDAVQAQWRIVDPILGNVAPLYEYPIDSWGPREADRVIGPEGWFDPLTSRH